MAKIQSITWIRTFLIGVTVHQSHYFLNLSTLTGSRKGNAKSLRPKKKCATRWLGHLDLGILQEVWLQKRLAHREQYNSGSLAVVASGCTAGKSAFAVSKVEAEASAVFR